jgi:hypothetical protein
MEESNTKRMNIRMPLTVHEWVVKEAADHGVSATAFISMKLSEIRKQEEMAKAMTIMTNKDILKMLEEKR